MLPVWQNPVREVFFDTEDLLKGFVAQRPEVFSPAVASVVLAQLNAVGGAGGAEGDIPLFGFDACELRPKVRARRLELWAVEHGLHHITASLTARRPLLAA